MKRIVVLNFFPAFTPPGSGGEARYFYLYEHLSRFHDVTLISHTYPGDGVEMVEHHNHFREFRVAKDELYLRLHHQLALEGTGPECSALVCALAGKEGATRYHQVCRELLPAADCVIHESPYTLYFDTEFEAVERAPRIYNSYNVESDLLRQILKGPRVAWYSEFVSELEQRLACGAELVLATSDEDATQFAQRFNLSSDKIRIVHNGYEPDFASFRTVVRDTKDYVVRAVFLGSGSHSPNTEAARLIIHHIAHAVPDMEFHIAGSVCGHFDASVVPSNVILQGFLSEDDKCALLASCAVGINPMLNGGGTNLKMVEFLAFGLAVVTTPLGARGLGLEDGVNALIAPPEEIPAILNRLLISPAYAASLGRQGQAHAEKNFTWAAAARVLAESVQSVCDFHAGHVYVGQPLQLLVLNDFPISPGLGGGQVRIREMYSALPEGFNITLLCLHDGAEERTTRLDHRFVEIAIPKTDLHRREDKSTSALSPISIADIVASRHCEHNQRFRQLVADYGFKADVVILEHPYLAPLIEGLPSHVKVVYSSLNVEVAIKKEMLKGRPDFEQVFSEVQVLERRIALGASLIAAVSSQDAEYFRSLYPGKEVVTLLNGVDCFPSVFLGKFAKFKERFAGNSVAVFLGSAHPPNAEAARFIVKVLAPALPKVYFLFIGSVCDAIRHMLLPSNVLLAGVVSNEEKQVLQYLADVVINPVISGGGSNLKVADALGAGKPLLSTSFGIRGFDLVDGQNVALAELAEFADKLASLLASQEHMKALSRCALRYARENLNWYVIASQYARALRNLFHPAVVEQNEEVAHKLLVVTHRYTHPPRGGAEHYLDQVLSRLGKSGRWSITLATIDATDIENRWHFSANYSNDNTQVGMIQPAYLDRLYRFPIAANNDAEIFGKCTDLFRLWMRESHILAEIAIETLSQSASEPCLLGGWYPAEGNGESCARWSSAHAEILIPVSTEASAVEICGYSPESKYVTLEIDGTEISSSLVHSGYFKLHIALDGTKIRQLKVRTTETLLGNDPCPLGLLVKKISIGSMRVRLVNPDVLESWRVNDADSWIAALLKVTTGRDQSVDNLFLSTRGPNVEGLQQWLLAHGSAYDVVLVHELPFSTFPLAADVACELGVPCVLLPHLHVEDRYYHWLSYVKALRQASTVLVAPAAAKHLYLDKLGGVASTLIQGGGIDTAEFEMDVEQYRMAFREKHNSVEPFFLVLGRKSGAKQYSLVIEAIAKAREIYPSLQLVMIGSDEDGAVINAAYVDYLGAQPREVVLGALFECVGLANMSHSESFGIVILEAWMAGKPVAVNRNCLAFQELVVHKENGWLCATVEDLVDAFVEMLGSEEVRFVMGSAGRKRAEEFTWSAVTASIEDALKRVSGFCPDEELDPILHAIPTGTCRSCK